jgi:hypothetical protein
MEGVFAIVLFVVAGGAIVFAIYTLNNFGGSYNEIGKGGLTMEPDNIPGPAPGTAAYAADAQAEIRQMVEAKSARREARGEEPLDIDAEVRALMTETVPGGAPPDDPGLRDEVRSMVVASNERRVRRGEEPLDVEGEVDRKLREFG